MKRDAYTEGKKPWQPLDLSRGEYDALNDLAQRLGKTTRAMGREFIRQGLALHGVQLGKPSRQVGDDPAYADWLTESMLDGLQPRWRAVLKLRLARWALTDDEMYCVLIDKWDDLGDGKRARVRTHAEVSELLGVTRARICQIEKAALARIQRPQQATTTAELQP